MTQTSIDRCTEIARAFGATKLILFGTAAESPESASDVDFACAGIQGWDLYRFGAKLEEALGRSVDVVPLRAGDRLSDYILEKGRTLYEAN
jgi:predicted nucleotidyltransferase